MKFNICNGHGNLPNDSCLSKSYQDEASYFPSLAQINSAEQMPSAHRDFQEDWTNKVKKKSLINNSEHYIVDESIAWKNVDERNKLLNTIETWSNYNVIKTNFEKLRDLRYFRDETNRDFFRRISWLYPDDGCWTRAAAVIKDLFGPFGNIANDYARPSKVFAFGNLCANTTNSPRGKVTWWYHTAPIIKDAETNQSYVLDPAVNPYQPMPTEKWMEEISSQTGACSGSNASIEKFNICKGYGVSPYDDCQSSRINFDTETKSMLGQSSFRYYERQRQIELGREVDKVLGELPPWKE